MGRSSTLMRSYCMLSSWQVRRYMPCLVYGRHFASGLAVTCFTRMLTLHASCLCNCCIPQRGPGSLVQSACTGHTCAGITAAHRLVVHGFLQWHAVLEQHGLDAHNSGANWLHGYTVSFPCGEHHLTLSMSFRRLLTSRAPAGRSWRNQAWFCTCATVSRLLGSAVSSPRSRSLQSSDTCCSQTENSVS